ncbi:MAG: disulfide bond formation protein DsbA [Isosphaera sp.]|nr:disulfide bond formation protein DsbA [Isosphaera sp.]
MITIDVYSDVICPWCYIGKRRLEKGIALTGRTATVRWHPFELNPSMPPEGAERRAYRIKKFGSWERSLELDAQVGRAFSGEGLAFHAEKMARTPNTFDAHRLIWLADEKGVQDAVVEALFKAYFTEGRDLSDRAVLAAVAVEGGIGRADVDELLAGDRGAAEVREREMTGQRLGVSGVPFFVINDAIALSGAQAPEPFRAAFEQATAAGECKACKFDRAPGQRGC